MDSDLAIHLGRQTLIVAATLAAPILGAGLIVGVTVAVVQAITSIQEQTMSLIPKMATVGGMVFFLMPWILAILVGFARALFGNLVEFGS